MRVLRLSLLSAAVLTAPAMAAPVVSTDTITDPWTIEARARWGAPGGFEGRLVTPDFGPNASAPAGAVINPNANPAWVSGTAYNFAFSQLAGNTDFGIDFNNDGDFLDSEESATYTSAALSGLGFQYIGLLLTGTSQPSQTGSVTLSNFIVNGTNLGSFTSNSNVSTVGLFEDTSGLFNSVNATGSLTFVRGTATGQERPRFYLQLGGPAALPVNGVPEPATWAMLMLGFGLVGTAARRRRATAITA